MALSGRAPATWQCGPFAARWRLRWRSIAIASGTIGFAAAIEVHALSAPAMTAPPPPRHPASLDVSPSAASDGTGATTSIRLRVYRAVLSDAQALVARQTAARILARAGVTLQWADCTRGDPRCLADAIPGTVGVRFFRSAKKDPFGPCGETFTRKTLPGGYISVDVSCVHDLVNRLAFGSDSRDGSTRMTAGLIAGVVLAHEVGHALREPHTRTGLMRVLLTRVELGAALDERLFFTDDQVVRIRAAADVLDRTSAVASARGSTEGAPRGRR